MTSSAIATRFIFAVVAFTLTDPKNIRGFAGCVPGGEPPAGCRPPSTAGRRAGGPTLTGRGRARVPAARRALPVRLARVCRDRLALLLRRLVRGRGRGLDEQQGVVEQDVRLAELETLENPSPLWP